MPHDAPRCPTCGAHVPAGAERYCSIHCEHYAGLASARVRGQEVEG